MSDTLFDALAALLVDHGAFVAALRDADSGRAAIAGALDAVAAQPGAGAHEGSSVAVGRLETLLTDRLEAARAAGELPPAVSVDDLAAFYASIVLGLLAETVSGGAPATLEAIRRLAMTLWPTREPARL